jgi:hypothetical protein
MAEAATRTRDAGGRTPVRMYELWKVANPDNEPRCLEDAGGPVLFERRCDAESYSWEAPDRWEVHFTIVPVTVGRA